MKALFTITISFFSLLIYAQNNRLFEDANNYYNEGKYQEAVDNYLNILETGQHSAALYYNLGNAYYKINQIAPSIYYYEKALQLSPHDADIKNNLAFAENMTIDAVETIPQTAMSKLAENIIGKFSYHTWAIASIVLMILFAAGFLAYYFSVYQHKKRLFFVMCIIALALCILSFISAQYQYNYNKTQRPAIIFEQEISVMSEPNDRSEAVFLLHEGTKVNVQEELGTWKKIRLADGKIGWLPAESLKEIKDF